ncbi:MAG: M43 family zinc metalloprotease [Bacteroidota bacterium]
MKHFATIFIVLSLFTSSYISNAQINRCGTVEFTKEQIRLNPLLENQLQTAKIQAQAWEDANTNEGSRAIIRIPVVFHVMHSGVSVGTYPNIGDAQLISQIDILNKDYRKTNSDTNLVPSVWKSIAADCEIEFCLASTDPSGNPTTGIDRINAGTGYVWDNDSRKASTTWNRNNYLNIWVVEFGPSFSGTLGYTMAPGGPANSDGVVIDANYIGTGGTTTAPYNKGRTATHEIGHWLGIDHIWGDDGTACSGSDGVSDTPNQAGENYGCPSFPHTDACTGTSPGVMFMNYMDYTDDACMYMFTAGQKAKMISVLNTTRSSIKTSTACGSVATIAISGTVIDGNTSAPVPNAKVLFKGASDIEVTTNGSGNFTANVVAGTYDVYAGKWSYMTNQFITGASYTAATSGIIIPINGGKYYDDFTLNYNWTTASTATAGGWVKDIPVEALNGSIISQTGSDVSNDFTDKCFVTGNGTVGGAAGAADVDGGTVTLTSPSFDLTRFGNPFIKCYVWFYNGGGSGTINDNVKLKINNGSTTVEAKNITYTGSENNWVFTLIHPQDLITLSNNMKFIVEASDIGTGHLVEAALDKFEIIDSFAQAINTPLENDLLVYPNPTKDIINIQTTNSNIESQYIEIYSAIGEKVYSKTITSSQNTNTISINTEVWNSGLYFIKYFNSTNNSKTIRFTKF